MTLAMLCNRILDCKDPQPLLLSLIHDRDSQNWLSTSAWVEHEIWVKISFMLKGTPVSHVFPDLTYDDQNSAG